ncbi:MAG: hypothetical protein ACRD1S_16695 [Vicinamibacterales bacterium]
MTEEERDEILRLLASYDDMTRAIMTLVRLVHAAPDIELDAKHASLVAEVAALAPVWRSHAASARSKLLLERRREAPDPPPDAYHGLERRRSWEE